MEAAHHEHRVTLTMQDLMRYFRVEELHYKWKQLELTQQEDNTCYEEETQWHREET
jgi:hypothetical protein